MAGMPSPLCTPYHANPLKFRGLLIGSLMTDDNEELTRESVMEMFYSMGGNLDQINAAIDAKLHKKRQRKITTLELYIKSRLSLNPKVLKLVNLEVNAIEAAYISVYPEASEVEVLDLRQNRLGDEGFEVIVRSEIFKNLKELDVRNNQITRVGVESFSKTSTLTRLETLDLRLNKLGKRWEEKLLACETLPNLKNVRTL